MELIDDDDPKMLERCEERASRADHHADLTLPGLVETFGLLPFRESGMDDGDLFAEACVEPHDGLIGQEEVVIKPLDELLKGTPGMAGATITSDGGIALIIDVPNLLKHYAHRQYKNMSGLSGAPGRI